MESLKVKKMYLIKQFSQIILIAIFLSSCRTTVNKEYPVKNLEENINDKSNSDSNVNKEFSATILKKVINLMQ